MCGFNLYILVLQKVCYLCVDNKSANGHPYMCDSYVVIDTDPYVGFSRGAYQVRVLSAMIDKVRYVLNFQ